MENILKVEDAIVEMKTTLYTLLPWVAIYALVQIPVLILGLWWQYAKPDTLIWAIVVFMSMSLTFWLLNYLLHWHRKEQANPVNTAS